MVTNGSVLDGVPAPCHEVDSLFDTVLLIKPEGDAMKLDILKCDSCSVDPGTTLMLDPSTMLIKQVLNMSFMRVVATI